MSVNKTNEVYAAYVKEINEMRILRLFVMEFSPPHAQQVDEMSYNELFDVVAEVLEAHKNK